MPTEGWWACFLLPPAPLPCLRASSNLGCTACLPPQGQASHGALARRGPETVAKVQWVQSPGKAWRSASGLGSPWACLCLSLFRDCFLPSPLPNFPHPLSVGPTPSLRQGSVFQGTLACQCLPTVTALDGPTPLDSVGCWSPASVLSAWAQRVVLCMDQTHIHGSHIPGIPSHADTFATHATHGAHQRTHQA